MRLVRDDGPLTARIAVIGEAPGATEEALGRPFVGAAGFKLNEWLADAGLRRQDLYVTNVVARRPTANKIETVPKAELSGWVDKLHERLATLDDPWVIVPTGNTALRALTGKSGIMKHRGSLYEYKDQRGRTVKVIPTIHPAAIFRTPHWERRCRRDWSRIASDATFRELKLPEREHFIRPCLSDVDDYVHDALARADALSLDIETPGDRIVCIAFSYEPSFSITIPLTETYWHGALSAVWDHVRMLLESSIPKITQNGHYDAFWLADQGIALRSWAWDLLAMHHALDPTDTHSLAYMASVDTRQPFWKNMRDKDDEDDEGGWKGSDETLWEYNGIDAAVQCELAAVYRQRLEAEGRLAFYQRHYQQLFHPILAMMRQGLRLDGATRRKRHARLFTQCLDVQERLAAMCGGPLHTTARNKKREALGKLPDLSNKKVATYLYETLRLPKQRDRATGNTTTKEVVVRRLMLRYPEKLGDAGLLILDHRRKRKLMEFMDEGKLDPDGRLRCTFKFTTDSGRFASRRSPKRTGRNLQNIDRELRDIFLPEPNCVFVEADASQAEDRIVKMLAAAVTGNQSLRDRARAMPWENDEHIRAASIIFRRPQEAISAQERQIAKPVRHGVNYGEGAKTITDTLMKDGIVLTVEECQQYLDALHSADPDIRAWQGAVRRQVLDTRCLVNSWGRMLTFDYDRLDDEVYRRAYAFVPQSEVPDLINQYGLIPLSRWLRNRRSVLHLQGHDSLLLSCPPDEVYETMVFLKERLERPRRIGGELLTIPVTFKCGSTWKETYEWKRFPTREEVSSAVATLSSRLNGS